MSSPNEALPYEFADRFTGPVARFFKIEVATGVMLLVASAVALGLSNSPWSAPFLAFWETKVGLQIGSVEFARSLRHWINDGLMTLFFFTVALELKRAIVLGELRKLRVAAFSLSGAIGGMIVPVGLFLLVMRGAPGTNGWGVVMATDTAFLIGGIALFGRRIPASLRMFLVSLAIFDDVGAILVVAVGYGEALVWQALVAAAVGVGLVFALARLGIRSIPVYLVVGAAIWACIDASGIHATITGVILGLMTPTRAWVTDVRLRAIFARVLSHPEGEHWSGDTEERGDLRRAGRAARESMSPVERLEIQLHPWVGFIIMPVFAIANAGVAVLDTDLFNPLTLAIIVGLVIGKPVGVFVFSYLSVRAGLATRPPDLKWSFLAAGALLTGIGFTMSLFIAGLAYPNDVLSAAKIGILTGSVISATLALMSFLWLTVVRGRRRKSETIPTD